MFFLSMQIKKSHIGLLLAGLFLLPVGCGTVEKTRVKKTTIVQKGVYHTVEEGQTIYRIAVTYKVDPDDLIKMNKIADPKDIPVGTKIFIPGAKTQLKVAALEKPDKAEKAGRKKGGWFEKFKKGEKKPGPKPGYFTWPVEGEISSRFGVRNGTPHDGLDIAAEKGKEIRAAAPGTVLFSDWGPAGYGNIIIIQHEENLITVYAHNKKNLVSKGTKVDKGEKIALLGDTGRATGPHLHFEVRVNRESVDPLKYLP